MYSLFLNPARVLVSIAVLVLISHTVFSAVRKEDAPSASNPLYAVTSIATGKPASVVLSQGGERTGDMVEVSQKGKTFAPAEVTIKAHRSIRIRNDDDCVHHVYCAKGPMKFNSGPQAQNVDVVIKFPEPGDYELRCAIHPAMVLKISVTPLGS